MPNIHEALLVNTVGHAAGALIFGIFLCLFLQDRAGSGLLRGSWLSFAAAGLAFLWDTISLAALISFPSAPRQGAFLVALSFAVLSLLPAVLLHLSLSKHLRYIVRIGYVFSFTSAGLHLWELVHPEQNPKHSALILIPLGFGILTLAAVLLLWLRPQLESHGKASQIAGAMCLFLFAISFVHFGSASPDHAWSSELIIHHAGIPIALFVLLQDYRFVLLDAFIRFLTNVLLAGLLTFAAVRTGLRMIPVESNQHRNPLEEALLLTAICFLLIAFALLRGRVQRLLTKVVFRRPDLEKALQQIRSRSAKDESEISYLQWCAHQMAQFLRSSRSECTANNPAAKLLADAILFPVPASEIPGLRTDPALRWVEAVVPLRLSHGDFHYVLLGRRQGGRRYLSEDLEFLSRIASAAGEQVDRFRGAEIQRLVSQAELRALQSQINPHFLFNAFNTLYGMIPREAEPARRTVLNLVDIFRYSLQSEKTFIPLGKELDIVRAYLEIEHLRLGTRLRYEIEVDDAALSMPIPILSIQPLVENAVKHGIAPRADPGLLRVQIAATETNIEVSVEDSGAGASSLHTEGAGVGLANVTRRLELCYGSESKVVLKSSLTGTRVHFSIPLPGLLRQT